MARIPFYDLEKLFQDEATDFEVTASPYPRRRDATAPYVKGIYDSEFHFRRRRDEAAKLGIAPPASSSIFDVMEYETRKSIRNDLKDYYFRNRIWDI